MIIALRGSNCDLIKESIMTNWLVHLKYFNIPFAFNLVNYCKMQHSNINMQVYMASTYLILWK